MTIPQDICFCNKLPAGTARNNGTLSMPNPTLVKGFPDWINFCKANVGGLRNGKTSAVGDAWSLASSATPWDNDLLEPNTPYPNCVSVSADVMNPSMMNMGSRHPGGVQRPHGGRLGPVPSRTAVSRSRHLGARLARPGAR